jgi:hypothetical protein
MSWPKLCLFFLFLITILCVPSCAEMEEQRELEAELGIGKITARDGRFWAGDTGIIFDTKTGLMWAIQDVGYYGKRSRASNHCFGSDAGGFSSWSLPTLDQLAELYDGSRTNNGGCHVAPLFKLKECDVWAKDQRRGSRDIDGDSYYDFKEGKGRWLENPYPLKTIAVLPVRHK